MVVAVLSGPDAVVVAAVAAAAIPAVLTWWNARVAARQTRPNDGSSLRDAVDRIEAKLDHHVIPRLDHDAAVMAEHDDRLAVLEARHNPSGGQP